MSEMNELFEVAEDKTQSSYRRRQAVSDILKEYPEDSRTLNLLNNLLGDADQHFKRDLVSAMRDVSSPQLLPVLKPMLSEDDDYLRRDIIQLIGKVGTADDLSLIEPLCDDKSFSVNYAAKQAVEAIKNRLPVIEKAPEPVEPVETAVEENPQEILEPVPEAPTAPEKPEPEPAIAPEVISALEPVEPAADEAVKPEPTVSEKIPRELQQVPESIHNNSIFEEKSADEVREDFENRISSTYTNLTPLLTVTGTPDSSQILKDFFAARYQVALTLYKHLEKASKELPQKELELSQTRRKVTLYEADKADDLEASEDSVEEKSKDVEEIEWQMQKTRKELSDIEAENKHLLESVWLALSATRKQEMEQKKAELNKKLSKLKKQLANEEAEFQKHQSESLSLGEPLKLLRDELQQKEKDCQTCRQKVARLDAEINQFYQEYLLGLDPLEMEQALKVFKGKGVVAEAAARRIIKAVARFKNLIEQVEQEKAQQTPAIESSQQKLQVLGEELAKCFYVNKKSRSEKVSIDASVKFSEEKSFWGYSNASGTASGRGEATARYEIEDIEWRPSPSINNALEDLTTDMQVLGQKSATLEQLEFETSAAAVLLRDYIETVRCFVESDFGG